MGRLQYPSSRELASHIFRVTSQKTDARKPPRGTEFRELIKLADRAFQEHDCKEAAQLYEKLVAGSSSDDSKNFFTSRVVICRLLANQPDTVLKKLKSFEGTHPQYENSIPLADAYLRRREFERALLHGLKAVQETPDSGRAHFIVGKALSAIKWDKEAEPYLQRAIRHDTHDTERHNIEREADCLVELALIYRRRQDYRESWNFLEKAFVLSRGASHVRTEMRTAHRLLLSSKT